MSELAQKAPAKARFTPLTGVLFLVLGGVFGFLLSRAGATTYDFYVKLFLFEDFQLLWVIAVAAGIGIVANLITKGILRGRAGRAIISPDPLSFKGKPFTKGTIPGSLIFGLGWGLAGACPGTALAMLGEGKLGSLFTIAGFFLGTWLFGLQQSRGKRA